MKKNTSIILLVLSVLTSTANAQHKWSAGYRTGFELNDFNLVWSLDFQPENKIWNHEVFITRKLGKHFEIASSLRVGQRHESGHVTMFDAPTNLSYTQTATNISLFLNIGYRFQMTSKLSTNIQLGTSFLKPFLKSEKVDYQSGQAPVHESLNSSSAIAFFNTISPGIGTCYDLTSRLFLSLNCSANYKVNGSSYHTTPYGNLSNAPNDWSANVLFGIGYRF